MLLISWYELEEVTAANSNAAVPGHVCSAILGEKSSGEAASSAMTRFKYGGCDEFYKTTSAPDQLILITNWNKMKYIPWITVPIYFHKVTVT